MELEKVYKRWRLLWGAGGSFRELKEVLGSWQRFQGAGYGLGELKGLGKMEESRVG